MEEVRRAYGLARNPLGTPPQTPKRSWMLICGHIAARLSKLGLITVSMHGGSCAQVSKISAKRGSTEEKLHTGDTRTSPTPVDEFQRRTQNLFRDPSPDPNFPQGANVRINWRMHRTTKSSISQCSNNKERQAQVSQWSGPSRTDSAHAE